jgi:hypothetical protein
MRKTGGFGDQARTAPSGETTQAHSAPPRPDGAGGMGRQDLYFWGAIGIVCTIMVLKGPMFLLPILPFALVLFSACALFPAGRRFRRALIGLLHHEAH